MPISFVMTLKKSSEPAIAGQLYKCQACYRPNLKSEFVSFISHGEAYCKVCCGESHV